MESEFGHVRKGLISTYREGYKRRGIPLHVCENDWQHSKRATKACVAHLIGSPERIIDKQGFPLMGFGHDWVEWEINMPDYTPACDITPEEKHRLESGVLERLNLKLGKKYSRILDKAGEYLEQETSDSKEFFYIDKSLAGVGALEYERLGFSGMEDFHPYTLDKLSSDDLHIKIYQILLEREFQHIDYFTQYFELLRGAGSYEEFYRRLNTIAS